MRLKTLALSIVMLAAATPAMSDETVSIPSGEVGIITQDDYSKVFVFNGKKFSLSAYHANIRDTTGDLVLIEIPSGGNACPSDFVWFDATNEDFSERFGTCSDYAALSTEGDVLTVTMPSFDPSEGEVAFDYQNGEITRRVLGLKSSGIEPGDMDAWSKRHYNDYLSAPENEAALIEMVGWDDLDLLRRLSVVGAAEMKIENGYLLGSGCRPHMCNTDFSAMAVNMKTGEALFAIKEDGKKARLIGKPKEALPLNIREVMISR